VFPVDAHLAYRFDYWRNQLLVPFVKVGPEVAVLHESRRDGSPTYVGINYAVGLQLNLDRIDWKSAKALERSMSIHHTYVAVEYLRNRYLGRDEGADLTRDEVRLGMRFEM
jgi:hypothetical protein